MQDKKTLEERIKLLEDKSFWINASLIVLAIGLTFQVINDKLEQ